MRQRHRHLRYRRWLLRILIDRMIGGLATTGNCRSFNLDPEDWDEVAGVMLCGLLGLDPNKYR